MKVLNINQIKKSIDQLSIINRRTAQQSKRQLAKANKMIHRAADLVEQALGESPRKQPVSVDIKGRRQRGQQRGGKRKAA